MRSPEDKRAEKTPRLKRRKRESLPLRDLADPQAHRTQIARVSVQHPELARALKLHLRKTGPRLRGTSKEREEAVLALHHVQIIPGVQTRRQAVPRGLRQIALRTLQAVQTGALLDELHHPQRVLRGRDLTLPRDQIEDLHHPVHEVPLVMPDPRTETLLEGILQAEPRSGMTAVHPTQHLDAARLDVPYSEETIDLLMRHPDAIRLDVLYSEETIDLLMRHPDAIRLRHAHESFVLTLMTDADQVTHVLSQDHVVAKMLPQAGITPPEVQLRVKAMVDQERLKGIGIGRLSLVETILLFAFSQTGANITGTLDRFISAKRISTVLHCM